MLNEILHIAQNEITTVFLFGVIGLFLLSLAAYYLDIAYIDKIGSYTS